MTVAVIDTGIDYTLPSLGGGFGKGHKVKAGYDFYADDDDPMDESGHGTNVAGVIAAERYTYKGVTYQGVAPDANLVALRVGTEDGISDDNIERALQWVVKNHKTYGIDVVNLSLGSGSYTGRQTDAQLGDEFRELHDLGIFVTAASGNSNDQQSGPISRDGVAFPAADPNVFAVGAVDSADVITTWSQRGDELDLLAPGVGLVLPKLGGGYVTESGTSFSSPYVAGAAALVRQADPSAKAGDIGSILMASGGYNRDGDAETGNTTTLAYARLDINAALRLTGTRRGKDAAPAMGKQFDTALDSQGVLHAAWYDTAGGGRLLYATRDVDGLWSKSVIVDDRGDVGALPSIAVDHTGKAAVAYFDVTNTALKYASTGNGATWSTTTVDSKKHVGTNPSLGFDIDGDAYVGYYRRSGGDLRLATLDRDTNTWARSTVDGTTDGDVGAQLSLDVGEAAVRGGFGFTVYDTTVAIAYSDTTHGDLKYSRLDVDDPAAAWYTSVVDNASGVSHVALDLHDGPIGTTQAQIAYQDTSTADVKYAYRNADWFTETVASNGKLGDSVEMYFDAGNDPIVVFYDRTNRAAYSSTRTGAAGWTTRKKLANAYNAIDVSQNERTGHATLAYLNRPKTGVFSANLI